MSKVDEALDLLYRLGVPRGQQNERSALTLLAITRLREDSDWTEAVQQPIIIHDIMDFVRENYGKDYAENSRETIRRQTIHQFEQAGMVIRNIDNPERPTNSPKTNYTASGDLLQVLHSMGTVDFEDHLNKFTRNHGRLFEIYNKRRKGHELEVQVDEGILYFSPGKHNKLQIRVIQTLKPHFFDEAKLLYVGDTADKMLYRNEPLIKKIGLPMRRHDKLPDLIYYEEKRNLLFLIEAVTSHGPMTPKRVTEIEEMLKDVRFSRIYISAFLNFRDFKRYAADIAWETEVWVAENPEHMIHFNGPKFLTVLD